MLKTAALAAVAGAGAIALVVVVDLVGDGLYQAVGGSPSQPEAAAPAPAPATTPAPAPEPPRAESPAPAPAPAPVAQVSPGQQAARKCLTCHTLDQGGPNRVGPNLWAIVGAPVAAKDGFAYSAGMKAHGGTWTPESLDAWIANPKAVVADTKMVFAGIKDPAERQALIEYLGTLK